MEGMTKMHIIKWYKNRLEHFTKNIGKVTENDVKITDKIVKITEKRLNQLRSSKI